MPIIRIGWKDAKRLIGEGYKITEYQDGHAELLGPKRMLAGGRFDIPMEGDAQFFLTKHSVELLKKNTKN
jgi:hypothetical protein